MRLVLFLYVFFFSLMAGAQSLGIDAYITDAMAENKIPCVGLAVIKDNKVGLIKVYGELAKGIPAPENAVFNIASMTKPVVAMLTLKLVNDGQWNLDEPLAKYYTDSDVKDDPRSKKLTTRHVLSHQTGFVNWRGEHPTKKLVFDTEPGTHFSYSGEGFEYLRHALENKFGKSLTLLMQEQVFDPLQMKDSRLVWDESLAIRYAQNHDDQGKASYKTVMATTPNAADDMLTTTKDYATFCIAVMTGFNLKKELFAEAVSPSVEMRKNMYKGLGWQVIPNLNKGHYVIGHDGGDQGVNTFALVDPVSGEGVVVLTNSDNGFSIVPEIVRQAMSNGAEVVDKILK